MLSTISLRQVSAAILFGIVLPIFFSKAIAASVQVSVDWPRYSSENKVEIYDQNGTLVATICDDTLGSIEGVGQCYSSLSLSTDYQNTFNFNFTDGNDYRFVLFDGLSDGWDGGDNITVTVDGYEVYNGNGNGATTSGETFYFDVANTPAVAPTGSDLTTVIDFAGQINHVVTGGTFRTADNDTDACSITASSSAALSGIPVGATIEGAYLYWSGSGRYNDNTVTLDGALVTADTSFQDTSGERYFFGGIKDVTSTVASKGNGTYTVAGLNIASHDHGEPEDGTEDYCDTQTVLGAWSLVVVYEDTSLEATNVRIFNGFAGDNDASNSYTLTGFRANASSGAKATFLAWEGDETISGVSDNGFTESLYFNGNQLSDGLNPATNIYNSTINSIGTSTAYGVDADTFDASSYVSQGDTSATVRVDAGQDYVILSAVVIQVGTNILEGRVFEDINYGGGVGRNFVDANGAGVEGATVEIYNNAGTLVDTTTTDSDGEYQFPGINNGSYQIRVVNSSVRSTRSGGAACVTCLPIQTFRVEQSGASLVDITNEIGGAAPNEVDAAANGGSDTLAGLTAAAGISIQTISPASITNSAKSGIDFGFNFDTIVNTNSSGQGSLAQFIVNSNALGNTGLDQEANSVFDPAAGDETSIFMIPSASLTSGIANISLSAQMVAITDANTHIDGRTQTANIGDTNTGTFGGGLNAGISATTLTSYNQPEVQIDGNATGEIFRAQANGTTIRNLAIFDGSFGVLSSAGSNSNPVTITENLIGVDADGSLQARLDRGIRTSSGYIDILNNYIAYTGTAGTSVAGGTETLVQGNHFDFNGNGTCADSIALESGNGITVQQNYLDRTAALGIDGSGFSGGALITENTITRSGQNGGDCSGAVEEAGIRLYGNGSTISSNIVHTNAGDGIVIAGGSTSGNLISQNSTYANGGLGIDLDAGTSGNLVGDGITVNDLNDVDSGANGLLNFPVFEEAIIDGTDLVVSGWSRPGAVLELFITDIGEGTASAGDNSFGLSQDYGEGQTYLVTLTEGSGQDSDSSSLAYSDVDGNADDTNRFEFRIAAPAGVSIGSNLTATATISNSTSEFGIFKVSRGVDFGDAPDASYATLFASDGARHGISSGIYLGASTPDAETDGQPNANADGDDIDANGDDEDGVTLPATLVAGDTSNITVVASVSGYLNGWIDLNADGDFIDTGEQIFTDQAVSSGSNNLNVLIPQSVVLGNSYARFRFSKQAGIANTPAGFAINGEVEDYLVVLGGLADLEVTKNDSSTEYIPGQSSTYTIVITNNGPSNVNGVQINDNLPNGVTLSGAWSCSATAGSSCSLATGGSAGDSSVSLTADILDGGEITLSIPVTYSSTTSDYNP
ncbi:MAG: carboxypeptidase regulatory-like domain-containing protein [Gammaproteobacteria bacterium]|nr:carboxypeptidase regulatory-like domain-containing protein [Gammaproteobacteria bacterium]